VPAHFADRLLAATREKGSPCCVGLDPRLDWLPRELQSRFGLRPTAQSAAGALVEFHERILKRIAPLVPAVKPQLAFFEQLGAPGIEAYEHLVRTARALGLLVIADAKRGDIGPTAEAYARAFFGPLEIQGTRIDICAADALTVNPFFGSDGVKPFLDAARAQRAGLFLLVRTSNPSSAELQAHPAHAIALSDLIADRVHEWGSGDIGEEGYSSVGAVVGATHPKLLTDLRKRMPRALFLLPGYGAQGGKAEDVVGAFDARGAGGMIVAARSVNFAYRAADGSESADWEGAIEAATARMVTDVRRALAARPS